MELGRPRALEGHLLPFSVDDKMAILLLFHTDVLLYGFRLELVIESHRHIQRVHQVRILALRETP